MARRHPIGEHHARKIAVQERANNMVRFLEMTQKYAEWIWAIAVVALLAITIARNLRNRKRDKGL
jgi:hypothetical protein